MGGALARPQAFELVAQPGAGVFMGKNFRLGGPSDSAATYEESHIHMTCFVPTCPNLSRPVPTCPDLSRFDLLLGGPPCQAFSPLGRCVEGRLEHVYVVRSAVRVQPDQSAALHPRRIGQRGAVPPGDSCAALFDRLALCRRGDVLSDGVPPWRVGVGGPVGDVEVRHWPEPIVL